MKLKLTIHNSLINGLFTLVFIALSFTIFSQDSKPSTFNGRIDDLDIYMELTNDNGTVIGYYEYPGKSTKLRLDGTVSDRGDLELFEFNYKGRQTGYYKGQVRSDNSISGLWQNPSGTKKLKFALSPANDLALISSSQTTNINESENINVTNTPIQERRMFQDSKVKGFTKLSLWVAIILFLAISISLIIIFKNKKQIKAKDQELKIANSKQTVNIFTSTDINNNKKLKKELADIFEEFMAEKLNSNNYIKITGRSADKTVNGKYLHEDTHPDIRLEFSLKDKIPTKIAVECKYSTGFQNDYKVNIVKDVNQLTRYKDFSNNGEKLVFIALGVGGPPNNPDELFIIPVDKIADPVIVRNDILIYKMDKPNLFFDPSKSKFNSFN